MVMMMAMVCRGGHPSFFVIVVLVLYKSNKQNKKDVITFARKKEVYTFDLRVLGVTELVCFCGGCLCFFFYQFASALQKDL